MKFVDEYRDIKVAGPLLDRIAALAAGRQWKFMEVCGGHTHAIYRHGLEQLLPSEVELVHGPGCPVCVIPMGRIDDAIFLAETPGIILATYGDLLRVPGSRARGNLMEARGRGGDVRIVYSPLDALGLAASNPDRHVVFLAVGFETTSPATAVTVLEARRRDVDNFSVLSNHVTIVPAIKAILEAPGTRLDGFIGPGHVSTIIGNRPYRFVADRYRKPLVTAGFEPTDILQAIAMLLAQHRESRCEIENQYARVVRHEGNRRATDILGEVFELRPHFEWRGLGFISASGLRLRPELARWDAEKRFAVPAVRVADPKACQCGEVLKGALKPWECKVFGSACTPETPIGTCMVSSEGACAAYYSYGRLAHDAGLRIGGPGRKGRLRRTSRGGGR